jgi:1,4-alpha-glucan branching enzyme
MSNTEQAMPCLLTLLFFMKRIHSAPEPFVCNFTPVPRLNYRVGVPDPGAYREILNTDSEIFGGANLGNAGLVMTQPISQNNRYHSLSITLPPLAVVAFESPGA